MLCGHLPEVVPPIRSGTQTDEMQQTKFPSVHRLLGRVVDGYEWMFHVSILI
jgi:hypothetical protein